MRAVVYKGEGKIAVEEKPKPVICEETDAIVRVTCTTICSSDIHIRHGAVPNATPGVTLGHEFVGVVEVLGAGPAGLCTMMCARLFCPAAIIGIDVDEGRLKVARENGLADLVCHPLEMGQEKLAEAVRKQSNGRGADVVFEMAGGKDTFQTAWRIARPNAVVVLAAMYEEAQLLPLPEMYGKNLIFKTGGVDGIYCERIMELIESDCLDAGCLITHRTDLEHIMEAYEIFEHKLDGVIKYAIHVD